jgi:hypothetical protein
MGAMSHTCRVSASHLLFLELGTELQVTVILKVDSVSLRNAHISPWKGRQQPVLYWRVWCRIFVSVQLLVFKSFVFSARSVSVWGFSFVSPRGPPGGFWQIVDRDVVLTEGPLQISAF